MPHPVHQKLAGFKTKVLTRADGAPFELAEICETLLELIEQNRNDLTEAFEAQVRVDQRLNALEKVASTYREPRG